MTTERAGVVVSLRRASRPPSVGYVLALITITHLALRLTGFAATIKRAMRTAARWPVVDGVNREMADQFARRVAMAAALYPFRARCLEQSIVLYCLLRRARCEAELRVGVQPYHFRAHAWVEHGGVPVNEGSDGTAGLIAFPRITV